ncbi:hypothetical protein Q1695_009718 [Nippostrongylus brasiliensis]|nr:hypothetical protein Q1695_009718 [Nippostrongylus brasiliensis]
MKENMQKIWQWIRDRKTNTIRKWRSSLVRRSESDDLQKNGKRVAEKTRSALSENGGGDLSDRRGASRSGAHTYYDESDEAAAHLRAQAKLQLIASTLAELRAEQGHSVSDINLPSTSKEREQRDYEQFFDEPRTKNYLDLRRQSFRDRSDSYTFPVIPPDLDDGWTGRTSPRPTPQPTPTTRRSPRQIRFQIPEIQVSLESTGSSQILNNSEPPTEIEWSSTRIYGMSTVAQKQMVQSSLSETHTPVSSLDDQDDMSTSSRRNSSSERARQNLLAQRRQSQIQLVQEMSGRRASTTLIPLTCAQIHLVRALWRQIYTSKGPTVVGGSIYHRLCFKCPQVKEQMRRVPLPPKFQNHDCFVKAHCKAIGELIDQVIDNLDNLDNMANELIRIGKVHAKLLQGELTGKLWNVVAETFIDCTLEWGDRRCRSETVRKAWALIVAFVIEKIKLGHHEQRKHMLTTRQSMPAIDVSFQSMKI